MSNYTQITEFTPKDSLTTGNPAKLIRGADFDPEFEAISVAIQSKYDSDDIADNAEAIAFTSDTKLITPLKLKYSLENGTFELSDDATWTRFPNIAGAVTADHTELNVLDGITASTAELNILDGATVSTAELNILDGVTSTADELNSLDGFVGDASELNSLVTHLAGIKVAFCSVDGATGNLHGTVQNHGITSTSRSGTGTYSINYTAAGFTQPPVILTDAVTASYNTSLSAGFGSTTSATITVNNVLSSGSLADGNFHFLAIGV